MHSRKLARIIAFILAAVLVLTFIISVVGHVALAAPSESEMDRLIAEGEELAQKIVEVESQINSFEFDNLTILGKKEMLDRLVILTDTEILNLNKRIATFDVLAVELEDDYEEAKNNENRQLGRVTSRIRAYEENGFLAYISPVFEAQNFAEFLGRIDFMSKILKYDELIFGEYSGAKAHTASVTSRINGIEAEKDGIRLIINDKELDRNKRAREAEEFLQEAESTKSGYEMLYTEVEAGQKVFENTIANKKAEQIRISPQIQPGSGAFIWPVQSSSVVGLTFGTKLNQTYNMYRVHNGIDFIGEYGSNVAAADSGMVTAADYDPVYGNYVVVNHGNGYETIYAHMSIVLVEEGQQIGQGTVIGYVGSTGYATEAHLHFEIRKDEICENPLSYYTGYTIR